MENIFKLMEYQTDSDLDGYVGLWTKADSTVLFKDLTLDGNLE